MEIRGCGEPVVHLLDRVDSLHRVQRQTEAQILTAAVDLALLHGAATVDPENAKLPGRQRAIWLGGDGTPKVAEFAPALLAGRLELSPYAAARLIGDALDLHFRLPRLGARVLALEVRAGHARYVARKTRDLTADQAAEVDAAVAEVADGRLHWSRFEDVVAAAIVAADPEAARKREAEAAQAQFATPTHSDDHGMRGFYVRADFATIARIDATVAYLADALAALGDRGSLDDRRVKAVLVMANPTRAVELLRAYAAWPATGAPQEPIEESTLLPAVVLYVHLAHQGRGVTRVEGERPLTETWLRETLGPRCRFKVTPVLDLAGQTPVDAWEIPDRHRRAVHLMTPADTFHPDHRGKNRRT